MQVADSINMNPPSTQESEELTVHNNGTRFFGICGGQGPSNATCLRDFRELCATHDGFLDDLIDVATEVLTSLARSKRARAFFEEPGFNLRQWIDDVHSAPEEIEIAPFSFPLIGLLTLAHFCITSKILHKDPGQLRDHFTAFTGHSQGIVAAAAIARSTTWLSFYESVRIATHVLFWIGFECHQCMNFAPLPLQIVKDSIASGGGRPTPMLSVRGLQQATLQNLLDNTNSFLDDEQRACIALVNARDNMVVAGPPKSLVAVCARLEQVKAGDGLDQSKVVFNQRKPVVKYQFLPMSSTFHDPRSDNATLSILHKLEPFSITGNDLGIGVRDTCTSEDLRTHGKHNIIPRLVRMITADRVNWPLATEFKDNATVVDFGPGRLGGLVKKAVEGTGIRVILASEFSSSGLSGSKASLSEAHLPPIMPNWKKDFQPYLTNGVPRLAMLETKMTRLFGVPPVMVAGMTPTSVPWEFVASVMQAGYHAELAGGGYNNAEDFRLAIAKLSENIPSTGSITCNIIYASPKAVRWQVPLIQDMVRNGYPINGLTIGAGVPSAEVVKEYIETMGLKHISFKPGSVESIKQVISIAKQYHDFPIGLQWTGGRAGGHHSFEDFNSPILETYSDIRKCENIVMIAGSGFGDARDTLPYLTGAWSTSIGYPAMPFDGVLLGSRMMVAKEARTSRQAKALIVEADGVSNSEWHNSYAKPTGGVITVKSEMGQPIHKLATRGVLLWRELDDKIFSITDRSKRLTELQKNQSWIVERLNKDFQKPYFGMDSDGNTVELEDMTYSEILQRLVQLMYIQHQKRWIDRSYWLMVQDFARRTCERLRAVAPLSDSCLKDPQKYLVEFLRSYPESRTEVLHPEDSSYFLGLCKQRGRKPVNFVPKLDEDFETWFKKDSLWQAEDVDALPQQDVQRACIIHGPVAARFSNKVDEPVKDILDQIHSSWIETLSQDPATTKPEPESEPFEASRSVPKLLRHINVQDTAECTTYRFHAGVELPDAKAFQDALAESLPGWASACISEESIRQDQHKRPNPMRSAFAPIHGHEIAIEYEATEVSSLVIRQIEAPSTDEKDVLRISKLTHDQISARFSCYKASSSVPAILEFYFKYNSTMTLSRLKENMSNRNQRIKRFYARLWLQQEDDELQTTDLHKRFGGERMVLTKQLVQDFAEATGSSNATNDRSVVPLDASIVVAWEAVVKPLLTSAIECDLLQLLHRSNKFKYVNDARPLQVGDVVESSSRVHSLTIHNGNKIVEVLAEIKRDGTPVVEILSSFFCKGSFTDMSNMMKSSRETEFEVAMKSDKEVALLTSRKWVDILCSAKSLLGKTLRFDVESQISYSTTGNGPNLLVLGKITSACGDGVETVGTIKLDRERCSTNPVLDFLNRHADQTRMPVPLPNPGLVGDSTWTVKAPKTSKPYGRISKDANPIHVSPVFAFYAQLPSTVVHGMNTSALVLKIVERTVADADAARIRRYMASFEGMVLPNDELTVEIQHVGMIEGRMVLKIKAKNERSGEKVLEAEAEIEQPPTAYIFTGQGSQEKGMGMKLYENSKAARAVWDQADKNLLELYGFSILDIVRNDPKSITVHFGGTKGRKIRDNYRALTISKTGADGQSFQAPILKELTSTSRSYTFADPRGLLYSTQFAQPAITLMEMASLVDMESRGLIQHSASYAGHSLGEYSALGALARAVPVESMVNLVFYRGLAMQAAMDRDESGRTDFSMMAANPSRVAKAFDQAALETVVAMIAKSTSVLLEIVNFNVYGRQYVCAGHLRGLWTLTQVLNELASRKLTKAPETKDLQLLVDEYAQASLQVAKPVELQRGSATIPLRGIDVPFHSEYLRGGIPAYRQYLETQILPENIDVDRLSGFIPNVMGKPFSTEKEYVAEAAVTMNSKILQDLVQHWGKDVE